ncbi:iron dependent repressor, metal binding and dimerization domain protein [Parafilimonas sp.]|uniref:iron dependent repressor, metal binding and dimerization domain protein n=1 Tax=Parafilimonas sp. TaxID=1969739 RepID=UPI0039E27DD6
MEHIHSPKLIEQLEKFLGYPEFDPHGDAIPNAKGELKLQARNTEIRQKQGADKACPFVNKMPSLYIFYFKHFNTN